MPHFHTHAPHPNLTPARARRLTLILLVSLAASLSGCAGKGGSSAAAPTASPAPATGSSTTGGTSAGSNGAPPAVSPFVVSLITPAPNALNIPHDAQIHVLFSEDVDPACVDASSVRLEVIGRQVAALRTVQGAEIILTPDVVLAPGADYTVRLETSLCSTSGHPLAAAFASDFRTDPAGGVRGLDFRAGVAVVDITPRWECPWEATGGPPRRLSTPDFDPSNWHTLFAPSTGVHDAVYAKALVLDDGVDRVALLSVDLIAADSHAADVVAQKLAQRGVNLDPNHILICASHNHSGPGAITDLMFWQIAAMDLYQFSIFDTLTTKMADALEAAVNNLQSARLGIALGQLSTISKNRRAGVSPNYTAASIDPDLGVIGIDKPDGTPLVTVYNFAVHGIAYGASNMLYSADLMGEASVWIESQLGGTALFVNAAEGDISPLRNVATTNAGIANILGTRLGDAVILLRQNLVSDDDVDLQSAWQQIDMGQPQLVLTPTNAAQAPPFFQTILNSLPASSNIGVPLPPSFMDRSFRYQAVRLQNTLLSSVPGEALHEIGLEIKSRGAALGFEHTFVFGLANGHMSYITTETEYNVGGYESVATLYGPKTGEKVVDACETLMMQVVP